MSRKDDDELLTFPLLIITGVFITLTEAMSRKDDLEMHTFSLLIIIHVFISITSTQAMS